MFHSGEYSAQKVQLIPGDVLLLYTDGLTEAQDKANAEYGVERLTELIKGYHDTSPQALTQVCLEDLKTFLSGAPKTDDLTIMVIRRLVYLNYTHNFSCLHKLANNCAQSLS
jgi:sigma-B regulation protein RsbU (phosphoserine phosphatase)